ncbi:MAG TPA: DUF5947 family protein [Pirellulales bacterium]|jgi:hypothetical protein|nr:DUF5947 family protein [Pirellulales bacterium]
MTSIDDLMTEARHKGPGPLAALQRLKRPPAPPPLESCELCGLPLGPEHDHLFESADRRLYCCCGACAVLFPGQQGLRFQRVPRDVFALDDFQLSDATWESMSLPIDLAFFFLRGSPPAITAMYPSPAGPVESLLAIDTWQDVVRGHPRLERIEPEVEALLVNRVGKTREYYLAPIDRCFGLVGLIRKSWRGLSGGSKVWTEIAGFFDETRKRAVHRPGVKRA